MARARSTIEIEGLFETEVLGTFQIIRGFASLQDLAEISVPVLMETPANDGKVAGHQRQLDDEHAGDVKRYFADGERQFIPEVILSLRVPLQPEMDQQRQLGVVFEDDRMLLKRKHKSKYLPNHILKIQRSSLEALRTEKRIRRIDGNHRLAKAAELPVDTSRPSCYKAPFCLLLLGDLNDAAQDYTEALVFHTINSTAKPLDGERALQLILGQHEDFTQPAHLEFTFAPALHLTRLLDARIRQLPEPAQTRLGGRSLARLSVASKELLKSYPEKSAALLNLVTFADDIIAALNDLCTHLHSEFSDFCAADYFIELATHVWMKADATKPHDERLSATVSYLRNMARWMGADGMRALTTGKPLGKQLTDIFDAVCGRVPRKVFLARWYPGENDGEQLQRANNRLAALRQVVETDLSLELIDMGSNKGGTLPIHQRMYEAIASSEIIIADLTGLRPNVMIELGFALNHMDKGRLLLLFNSIAAADKVPFDTNTFRYEQIGEAADIPNQLRPHLDQILADANAGLI